MCVMDRLAWYFHDADTQCLEQAIQVAMRHPVDLKRIERWARCERPHGEERIKSDSTPPLTAASEGPHALDPDGPVQGVGPLA